VDEKIVIYADLDTIEEIIIFEKNYPNLNKIFQDNAVFCLNISDEEFDKIWNEESDLFVFCTGHDIPFPVALNPYFETLKEDYSIIVEKPRALFFLNENADKIQELQNLYGILVVNKNDIRDNILQLKHFREFDKNQQITGTSNGWKNTLSNLLFPPSNSIVLSDNYLFSRKENGDLIGESNLVNLINVLLPPTLSVEFHILIISSHPKISSEECNRLLGRIKANILRLRDYSIVLEFVFSDTIHKRILMSNYYNIKCDKGFEMFKISNNQIVLDPNDIDVYSVLHDPTNSTGDSAYKSTTKKLKDIKAISNELREQINAGIIDPEKKIAGDCKKDKSLNNRLIQCV
jgi:hypothetical protein